VITDLAEIARQGTVKSGENLQFRRYLAAHHQRVEAFQAVATEVQRRVDCTACANCCRYSIVSVRGAEVARIATYLGQSEEAVVHRFTTPDAESPRARTLASGKGGCVFLKGNRCGIYPARPEACRNFPHVARGTHSLGGRLASVCRWAPLCPVVFNALEEYKHLVGFHTGHMGHSE
jgi:Fe-S-cluster containining protein